MERNDLAALVHASPYHHKKELKVLLIRTKLYIYRKYYYSRFPIYDSDVCISGTPPPVALHQASTFHQAVCECWMEMDHRALSVEKMIVDTKVMSEINTHQKTNETQLPTTSPISNTFPGLDTFPGLVFGPIRLLCHPWNRGNDASPLWQNGTYTTVVSPSPPNTRFLQRWRKKKWQLGDKKLRDNLNFEEIVYMIFHKTIVWRLKKRFSSRAVLNIYSFGGNSFWFAKIQEGPFWFGHL